MASFAVESLCEQTQKGPLLVLQNTQIYLHEYLYSGQNEQTNLSLITSDDRERPSVINTTVTLEMEEFQQESDMTSLYLIFDM